MKQKHLQQNTVLRAALAMVLVFALVLGCTGLGWAVDLSRSCSVTVSLGTGALADELREAELVVDVYRVAGAMERVGEDAYDFASEARYAALDLSAPQSQEDWTGVAYEAARIARADDTPYVKAAPVETPVTDLTPGLYLLLIHGRGESEVSADGEGVAYHGENRYLFAPQLLALPSNDPEGTGVPGAWVYDATVLPKPEIEQAYGKLQIVKALRGYDESNPAMFLFSIEATLHGETVYSDVVTMSFTAEGNQTLVIDRLPLGATVTVTEIYCSPGYQIVSEQLQTVTITPDTAVTVAFVNQYVGSPNGLRGIDNHFMFEEDAGWSCTQTPLPSD